MDKLQEIINKLKYIEGYLDGVSWSIEGDIGEAINDISNNVAMLVSFIKEPEK